jgi:alpha-beta hydrolase superfamily lysophospholipase
VLESESQIPNCQSQIQHFEGTFQGFEGLELYYQSWYPPGQVRAILVIVHGLGAHSGLFGNLVRYLVPKNYAIYEFDLRGNGRSPGQRGYINCWSEFREDLSAFLRLIEGKEPHCPIFLLGHSLGAIASLDYILRFPRKARGIVALSPTLGKVGVSPFRLMLARLLSRILPRFSLSTGLDLSASTRDPIVLADYARDPLRHDQASARLATEFFETLSWIQDHSAELQVPLLILHGGSDRVALPEGSRLFFEKVTYPDKELHEYLGAYHEMHNDLNSEEMVADLENWLERHLLD